MIKDDLAYIEHILDCIRKINEFSAGLLVGRLPNTRTTIKS